MSRPDSVPSAVDLSAARTLHIVGIGGAGMSAIATVLARMGHRVSGSDLKDSRSIERLGLLGVEVAIGHDAAHLPDDADAVIVSTAIPRDEPRGARGGAAGDPGAATRRGAASDRRHASLGRRRRQPRQDDDLVDARAVPPRRGLAAELPHRRRPERGRHERDATTTASG